MIIVFQEEFKKSYEKSKFTTKLHFNKLKRKSYSRCIKFSIKALILQRIYFRLNIEILKISTFFGS